MLRKAFSHLLIVKRLRLLPKFLGKPFDPFFEIAMEGVFVSVVRCKIASEIRVMSKGKRIGKIMKQHPKPKGVKRGDTMARREFLRKTLDAPIQIRVIMPVQVENLRLPVQVKVGKQIDIRLHTAKQKGTAQGRVFRKQG